MKGRLFCVAEDRASEMPGVLLLVASLLRFDPEARVRLIVPAVDAPTRAWLERFDQVAVEIERVAGADGWNVKPKILLDALDRGHGEVVWLDSDIIVTSRLTPLLDSLPPDVLLVAEEALGGIAKRDGGRRARAWSLPVRRSFPSVLNSCVIRATPTHAALLRAWDSLLSDPDYLAAQALPFDQRPVHYVGDQDVLTALLSSDAFAAIPIDVLRQGREIVQFYGLHGFTVGERLRRAFVRKPLLVHSQGAKPWRRTPVGKPSRDRRVTRSLLAIYQETSPYIGLARRYRDRIPGDHRWMTPSTWTGRALVAAGMGSPALTGLPLAMAFDLLWLFKQWRRQAQSEPS